MLYSWSSHFFESRGVRTVNLYGAGCSDPVVVLVTGTLSHWSRGRTRSFGHGYNNIKKIIGANG